MAATDGEDAQPHGFGPRLEELATQAQLELRIANEEDVRLPGVRNRFPQIVVQDRLAQLVVGRVNEEEFGTSGRHELIETLASRVVSVLVRS